MIQQTLFGKRLSDAPGDLQLPPATRRRKQLPLPVPTDASLARAFRAASPGMTTSSSPTPIADTDTGLTPTPAASSSSGSNDAMFAPSTPPSLLHRGSAPPSTVVASPGTPPYIDEEPAAGQSTPDGTSPNFDLASDDEVALAQLGHGTIAFPHELHFNDMPSCSKCGFHVDPCLKGVRLMTKSPPSYKCNRCCSKHVQLVRIFGTWPLPEFRELDEETQMNFFRNTDQTAKCLKQTVTDMLTRNLIEKKSTSEAGPYWPLSVWAKQGYDITDIADKAPMKVHSILGKTYQVQILSSSREKIDELVRQQVLSKLVKRPASRGVGPRQAPPDPLVEPQEPDSVAEDSSSAPSSSESSSSGKKHKKKHRSKKSKKAKKHKKDKPKEKKAEQEKTDKEHKNRLKDIEKAEKKAVAKNQMDSTKVLSKISPVILQLQSVLTDDAIGHCPKFAVDKAKDAMKVLSGIEVEAKKQLTKGGTSPMSFTLEEVTVICKEPLAYLTHISQRWWTAPSPPPSPTPPPLPTHPPLTGSSGLLLFSVSMSTLQC
jgi:hypothetical protein